jgi:hypothetical protein
LLYFSSLVNGVLLADGWHDVAGELRLDYDPQIVDTDTGVTATPVGGAWMRWVEPDGKFVFTPLERALALRHTPVAYVKAGGAAGRGGSIGTHDA